MIDDIAGATLDKVKQFTVGFGRAGDEPAAKGSGVPVKYGGMIGILTCAHVDRFLRKSKQPIGLVRLNRGLIDQFGTLNMEEVYTYAAASRRSEYGRGAADRDAAKPQTISLFLTPRTLSTASATWCGHLRLISGRVISSLRRVIPASRRVGGRRS